MTDQEINKLADVIVKRLIERQQYYDEKFINIIMNMPETEEAEIGFMPKHVKTNEEIIALHLDRLESMLHKYLEEEKYEDAARVQKEIDRIKNKQ